VANACSPRFGGVKTGVDLLLYLEMLENLADSRMRVSGGGGKSVYCKKNASGGIYEACTNVGKLSGEPRYR
jgi:hypothetical protein